MVEIMTFQIGIFVCHRTIPIENVSAKTRPKKRPHVDNSKMISCFHALRKRQDVRFFFRYFPSVDAHHTGVYAPATVFN